MLGYEVTHYKIKCRRPSGDLYIRKRKEGVVDPVSGVLVLPLLTNGCIATAPFLPNGSSQPNMCVACVHRFGCVMPPCHLSLDFYSYSVSFIHKYFTPLDSNEIISFDEWVTSYSGSRQKALRAVKSKTFQISEKDCKNKSFIKWEAYDEVKNPRAINSYTDETKVILGPIIRSVDKKTFQHKWFVKGEDPRDRPQKLHLAFGERRVFGTDFSSFEAHHHDVFARVVRYWMMHMLRTTAINSRIKRLISRLMLGHNVCEFKTITAQIPQRLMSGALWTSSANGVLNLLILSYLCTRTQHPHLAPDQLVAEVDNCFTGFIEGDDGIFQCRGIDNGLIQRMGLNLKLDEYEHFSKASFCGIVCDSQSYTNIKDPRKILRNFFLLPKAYEKSSKNCVWSYLRAKALSYKYLFNDCPIVGELCHRVCQLTRGQSIRGSTEIGSYQQHLLELAIKEKVWKDAPQVRVSSRRLVEELFGIGCGTQVLIEQLLRSWDGGAIHMPDIFSLAEVVHARDFVTPCYSTMRPLRTPPSFPVDFVPSTMPPNMRLGVRRRQLRPFSVPLC